MKPTKKDLETTRYYEIQQWTAKRTKFPRLPGEFNKRYEPVGAEPDLESAERCLRVYRENQPEYPVRKRVRYSKERIYWGSDANKYYGNMGADGYKIRPYWLTDKYKDDIMKHPNDY